MSALPPPDEKAAAVRSMFDRISPSYDRVNRVMTMNADQRWRRALVRKLGVGPGDTVLDLACGTGDFTMLCRQAGAEAVGVDFSGGMLRAAVTRHNERSAWVQGDALELPLKDETFTVAVSGFALRNFVDIAPAMRELARVLKPGGRLGLLEVDRPANPFIRFGHGMYFNRVVPLVGGALADRQAYRYLPQSASYLPPQEELVRILVDAGFHRVQKRSPMFGAIQSVSAVRR